MNNLPEAYIYDVDGTICLFDRFKVNPYSRDWSHDHPNIPLINVMRGLHKAGFKNIIVSGRTGSARAATEQWFAKHGVPYDEFYIRAEGDRRPDQVLKQEIYENHIKDRYNVLGVFDDRMKVVKFWESIGLYVFCCNQGRIEF